MFASLSGSSPNLNLYFRNKLKELSLSGLVNINNLLSIYTKKERFINVYMFAGLGIVNFRSKLNNYTDDTFVNAIGWDSLGKLKTSSKILLLKAISFIKVKISIRTSSPNCLMFS